MLLSKGNYIFDGVEEKTSQKGFVFRIAKIIDTEEYQRLEFFCDDQVQIACEVGKPCVFGLKPKRNGFKVDMNLVSVQGV